VSTIEFNAAGLNPFGDEQLIKGGIDIIPVDLAMRAEFEVGLEFEIPLPRTDIGEIELGTIPLPGGISFGPIAFGPQSQLVFGASLSAEGSASITVGGEITFSNDARGRIDFSENQDRPSEGW